MELKDIISRLDNLKKEFDKLRPLREDYLNRLNQKLRLDWNYHSNSIEGNTLTQSETKSFLLWGITAKGKPFRDYLEMKGHSEALNKLFQIINKDLIITEKLIKEFHKLILVEPYQDNTAEVNPGEWKTLPNYLYSPTNERIDFVPPEEVSEEMNKLINWLNNHLNPPKRKKKKYDLHPLIVAVGFHVQFIKIHPFGDGNGRMARILTNLILMFYDYIPAVIKLEDRRNYYTSINTSSLDTPENLALFLGNASIESLEMAIKAAKGESIEEDDDIDKELKLLEQKLNTKIDFAVKSKEEILEIIEKSSFPFFDKLVFELSKFQKFFNSKQVLIAIDDGWNRLPLKERKIQIRNTISNTTQNVFLRYHLLDFSKVVQKFDVNLEFTFYFHHKEYIITDNLTSKSIKLLYGEMITEEQEKEWLKDIKKFILNEIKNKVN